MSNVNRSFASLPALRVRDACQACISRIEQRIIDKNNAALDREIARRAKGWLFGLCKQTWDRDDAKRYFESFTGIDACFNPLWRIKSDQHVTAERLMALADVALAAGEDRISVTADDFDCICSFYGATASDALDGA